MLPKISVSCRRGAMLANVQRYRMLISDELSEELLQFAHVEAYAERIIHQYFLLPRLVRDELRLVKQMVG